MKYFSLFLLLSISICAHAQTEPVPAYVNDHSIPTFTIQLADSSWFYKEDLKKNKPTLILYFSPDCGHCKTETEDMISRMNDLKDLQIVMITSRPLGDMVPFEKHFLLNRFPQIKIGSDTRYFVTRFFDVKFTPYSAVYNKKGKFVKEWRKGIDWDELLELLK
jgi:peroxiredoxin